MLPATSRYRYVYFSTTDTFLTATIATAVMVLETHFHRIRLYRGRTPPTHVPEHGILVPRHPTGEICNCFQFLGRSLAVLVVHLQELERDHKEFWDSHVESSLPIAYIYLVLLKTALGSVSYVPCERVTRQAST